MYLDFDSVYDFYKEIYEVKQYWHYHKYTKHGNRIYIQTPGEYKENKKGDCFDNAVYFASICKKYGLNYKLVGFLNKQYKSLNHVCLFVEVFKNKWLIVDRYSTDTLNYGFYKSFEEALENKAYQWSYSIGKTKEFAKQNESYFVRDFCPTGGCLFNKWLRKMRVPETCSWYNN